jgi:5-methylcytosine-specific restriction endonuclease McrA
MLTPHQVDAVRCALVRVDPNLSGRAFETELSWQLMQVSLDSRGCIVWKSFELGRRLFVCLAEAQNWRCCYLGERMEDGPGKHPATFEHAHPKASGGADHPDNLVIACERCNQLRGPQLIFPRTPLRVN